MPHEFEALAQYNAERWRGLTHTPEHDAKMAELQREFNEWAATQTMTIPGAHGRGRLPWIAAAILLVVMILVGTALAS